MGLDPQPGDGYAPSHPIQKDTEALGEWPLLTSQRSGSSLLHFLASMTYGGSSAPTFVSCEVSSLHSGYYVGNKTIYT